MLASFDNEKKKQNAQKNVIKQNSLTLKGNKFVKTYMREMPKLPSRNIVSWDDPKRCLNGQKGVIFKNSKRA